MLKQRPYTGSIRGRAVAAVVHAIREQEILLLLTGSAGAGKTVVLRAALARLASDSTRIISLDNPRGAEWGMSEIAGQIMGRPVDASAPDLLPAAIAALTAAAADERQLVVAVDDAHTLTGDALEFLLLLASPARSQLRPQLILAGRGEFWTGQPREELQLITRLAERVSLEPLTRAEVKDHVAFRLGEPDRALEDIVSPAALTGIMDYSAGLPGRIDEIVTASTQILACRGGGVLSADVVEAAAASMASAPGMSEGQTDFIAPRDAIRRPTTEATARGALHADYLVPRVAEPLALAPPQSIRRSFSTMSVEEFLPPNVLNRWTPSVPIPPTRPIVPNGRIFSNKPVSPNGPPSANEANSTAPPAGARDATPRSRHPFRAAAIVIGVVILSGLAWRVLEPEKRIAAAMGPWLGSPRNAGHEQPALAPATGIALRTPERRTAATPADDAAERVRKGQAAEPSGSSPPEPMPMADQATPAPIPPQRTSTPGDSVTSPAVETTAAAPAPVSVPELTSRDATPPAEGKAPVAASPVDGGGPQSTATGPDNEPQLAPVPPASGSEVAVMPPAPPAAGSGVSVEPEAGGAAASTVSVTERHPDALTPPEQSGVVAASQGPAPGLSLLRRGEALLGQGDVLAARLFFERAALQGNAAAALRAAKTHDPDFIATIDAPGLKADVSRAIKWYRQAFDASHDPEAAQRLAALSARASPVVVNGSGR